jgi:hypothetical protein
MLMVLVQGL